MNVEISEIHTRVKTREGGEPGMTRQQIIDLIVQVVREERGYEQRVRAERKVSSGVRDEIEGES